MKYMLQAMATFAALLVGCAPGIKAQSETIAPASPPRTVRIEAPWQLISSGEVQGMTDEQVEEYIRLALSSDIYGRDELIEMIRRMEGLPVPLLQGFSLRNIVYEPYSAALTIYFDKDGRTMWITANTEKKQNMSGWERELEREGAELIWQDESSGKAYALPDEDSGNTQAPATKKSWRFVLLKDGYRYFMRMFVYGEGVARDYIKSGLSFVTIEDIREPSLWLDPPPPGDALPTPAPDQPENVCFTGPGQLVSPADVEAMTDEDIQNYIGETLAPNGLPGVRDREDVMDMARNMWGMSLPMLRGLKIQEILYWPESGRVDISWRRGQKDEEYLRVDFSVGASPVTAEEYREDLKPEDIADSAPGSQQGGEVWIYLLDTWAEHGYSDFVVTAGDECILARTHKEPGTAMELMVKDLGFISLPSLAQDDALWGYWPE